MEGPEEAPEDEGAQSASECGVSLIGAIWREWRQDFSKGEFKSS